MLGLNNSGFEVPIRPGRYQVAQRRAKNQDSCKDQTSWEKSKVAKEGIWRKKFRNPEVGGSERQCLLWL
jgi:hypothetical protein